MCIPVTTATLSLSHTLASFLLTILLLWKGTEIHQIILILIESIDFLVSGMSLEREKDQIMKTAQDEFYFPWQSDGLTGSSVCHPLDSQ